MSKKLGICDDRGYLARCWWGCGRPFDCSGRCLELSVLKLVELLHNKLPGYSLSTKLEPQPPPDRAMYLRLSPSLVVSQYPRKIRLWLAKTRPSSLVAHRGCLHLPRSATLGLVVLYFERPALWSLGLQFLQRQVLCYLVLHSPASAALQQIEMARRSLLSAAKRVSLALTWLLVRLAQRDSYYTSTAAA